MSAPDKAEYYLQHPQQCPLKLLPHFSIEEPSYQILLPTYPQASVYGYETDTDPLSGDDRTSTIMIVKKCDDDNQ